MESFSVRGFLPTKDPATKFEKIPELAWLDELGHDLPSLLQRPDFRDYCRGLKILSWPEPSVTEEFIPELRLYYLRLGFLASAYINQVGQPACHTLPANIAAPLVAACQLLKRPPILSYDGYALYNWKRFDKTKPIQLGNIDTLQNFVHLYDEHWFILVHVEIEALAATIMDAIESVLFNVEEVNDEQASSDVDFALARISSALSRQVDVLRRTPEKMSPLRYFNQFRPYIRFFEQVVYEGVKLAPIDHRGETGAQSSIMPTLVAFMKISHQPSELTNHLLDMRQYMPAVHRDFIAVVESAEDIKGKASSDAFNNVLELMAQFREVHYQWAIEYIAKRESDPRGTGGTPYMQWLKQLINETRAWKK